MEHITSKYKMAFFQSFVGLALARVKTLRSLSIPLKGTCLEKPGNEKKSLWKSKSQKNPLLPSELRREKEEGGDEGITQNPRIRTEAALVQGLVYDYFVQRTVGYC